MTRLLPSSRPDESSRSTLPLTETETVKTQESDAKLVFGTEFWRLEYLLHLIETGRVKDQG